MFPGRGAVSNFRGHGQMRNQVVIWAGEPAPLASVNHTGPRLSLIAGPARTNLAGRQRRIGYLRKAVPSPGLFSAY